MLARVSLWVALLSTAIPYSLEMVALTKMPTRTFGMLMSLEPAIAALCGLLFLHERLSLLQWLAIAAIIVASAGAAMTTERARPSAPRMFSIKSFTSRPRSPISPITITSA